MARKKKEDYKIMGLTWGLKHNFRGSLLHIPDVVNQVLKFSNDYMGLLFQGQVDTDTWWRSG